MMPIVDDLTIESLAYGGSGVAHHDGKVVFVPLTAPGDRLRCRIVREKKRFSEGVMERLLESSPVRRSPPCPVFGQCGGCQWQHLTYAEQCRWKENIFADFLVRKVGVSRDKVLPLVPAPEEWGYRSRAQFKCRLTPDGFVMGFYRRASHYVVAVEECAILHPLLNRAKSRVQTWLRDSPWAHCVPQVDLAMGHEGAVRAVIHCLAPGLDGLADYLRPRAEQSGLALFVQSGRKDTLRHVWGERDLIIEVGEPPLHLAYGPGGFAQINLAQNRTMVQAVCEALAARPPRKVLDLFCGMGNFSLPLARLAHEVVGVEGYPPSIETAHSNARRNGLGNVAFHARDALGAATLVGRGQSGDLVMLDPPRSGAREVVKELVGMGFGRIVYVSCDPATLARDLLPLLHSGYRLIWSRPFDLFPQTHHTESITFLERMAI
jgi:23S rRNA (uracil1939-C5)-methyltransferase